MTDREPAERAEGLVNLFLDERLDDADEPPGFREAVIDLVADQIDAINDRFHQQFDLLRRPNSKRIPDAYYADEQAVEDELQKAAAGIRTTLALGGILGDPIAIEQSVARRLSPTGIWSMRSEASRVPRPPTRADALEWSLKPIPWVGDEDAEWPPADAAAVAGVRQLTGHDGEPVRVVEAPYTDWVQVGFFERQGTLASSYPKTPSRQLLIATGLEVCDGPPRAHSMPLSTCPPSLWAHPYTKLVRRLDNARAREVLGSTRGPLAALVDYERQPGGPARERGPGLHPFVLSPRFEVVALLDLRPEEPAIRHVLVDDNGPALVCRQWHGCLIHDGSYGDPVPAVHGSDLILRSDLFERLAGVAGRDRLSFGLSVSYLPNAEPDNGHEAPRPSV